MLIALANVKDGSSYDLTITTIPDNNPTPKVVNLKAQTLSATYQPDAIPAGLAATTQIIVAVFAVGTTTPLNAYIKGESAVKVC